MLLTLCVIILTLILIKTCVRPKNFPPGPPLLPIIGCSYALPAQDAPRKIRAWRLKYGDMIGMKVFHQLFVFICSEDKIVDGLKHNNFQARAVSELFEQRSFNRRLGLFFSDGEQWLQVRQFTLRFMGKIITTRLEDLMQEEMIDVFLTMPTRKEVTVDNKFANVFFNIIVRCLTNCDVKKHNDEMSRMNAIVAKSFNAGRVTGIETIFPILKKFFNNDLQLQSVQTTQSFLKDRLAEQKKLFDPEVIDDNYMNLFLHEQEKELKTFGKINHFTDEELISCSNELLQAGNESISKTVGFMLYHVASNPDVQAEMHRELDSVIGLGRYPSLQDRENLPYCEAAVHEAFRINTIAPIAVMHVASADTEFYGYTIPKDTWIAFCLEENMNDPDLWENPYKFEPKRFITNGKFEMPHKLYNFGQGKRMCVASIFSKNALFLFVTYFFQRYRIRLPEYENKLESIHGFTTGPKSYKLIVEDRF